MGIQSRKRFVAVIDMDSKWAVFLIFSSITQDGRTIIDQLTPDLSLVFLLNLKGPYRENQRPFETMYKCILRNFEEGVLCDSKVLSREEAKSDKDLQELYSYLADVDERVKLYWKDRKDERCVQKLAPSDKPIPNNVPCLMGTLADTLYGFEGEWAIIG
jgi:hypothetical protein